jgi:hypothetical protein
MIGHEPEGTDEHALDTALLQLVVEDIGAEPRLTRRRLALERERPVVDARRRGDELRRLEQLVAVRVAVGEDPGRQRVRREDDVRVGAADAVGEQLDEPALVVPALDERDCRAARDRILELRAVARDREAAVVRCARAARARARARRASLP